MAPRYGFEPQSSDSESEVLPLNDLGIGVRGLHLALGTRNIDGHSMTARCIRAFHLYCGWHIVIHHRHTLLGDVVPTVGIEPTTIRLGPECKSILHRGHWWVS